MKIRKIHKIVIGEKVIDQSTKIEYILNELKKIRKTTPSAYVITTYC